MSDRIAALVTLMLLVPTPSQAAGEDWIQPGLKDWTSLTFDNLVPNEYREEDGALRVISDRSVSILHRPVQIDPKAAPILSWRWRVDAAPPATDLSRKGGDDRALSIAVAFEYDSQSASLWERVKRRVVEAVAGKDAPGRVITYTWGGSAPSGTVFKSPYTGNAGQIVILRDSNAELGAWFTERVDIASAYRDAWGTEPTQIINIGVSADSDDTAASADGRISNIRFGS